MQWQQQHKEASMLKPSRKAGWMNNNNVGGGLFLCDATVLMLDLTAAETPTQTELISGD